HLRQAVLMEQDDNFLQTLPAALLTEATAFREAVIGRDPRRVAGIPRAPQTAPGGPSVGKKTATPRDAINLLDKTGVATLVRLLFYPQVTKKSLLQKVLANLCENSRSRSELLNLLLGVLHEGTGDLVAVDKSFAQMSVRSAKGPAFTTPKATPRPKT